MLLYYITDRQQLKGATEDDRRKALLRKIGEAASAQVDFIQLREKDLLAGELETLARDALRVIRENSSTTRLLINSRIDVAIAVGADGVHLTSSDLSASEARSIRSLAIPRRELSPEFVIAVSCHSSVEVRLAESHGADFAVLAPIFGKVNAGLPGIGLDPLREATLQTIRPDLRVEAGDHRVGLPVLALGSITLQNAPACIRAGAAGIAGIRLFQEGEIRETVSRLRST